MATAAFLGPTLKASAIFTFVTKSEEHILNVWGMPLQLILRTLVFTTGVTSIY
jgi:hypothetical protein